LPAIAEQDENVAIGDGAFHKRRAGDPAAVEAEIERITVVSDGFVWRDARYASLSMIARAITGTAWNGPRFFGLRVPAGRANEKERSGRVAGAIHVDQGRASGRQDKKDRTHRG
jgi:hypothetical protein